MRSTSWWSRLSGFERLALGALALVAAAAWLLPLSALEAVPLCLFRAVTGWRCPGCGMGHAVLAALRGDFAVSWAWHPLGPPLAVLWVAWAVVRRPILLSDRAAWGLAAGVLLVHALR